MIRYNDFYRILLGAGDCKDFDEFVAECGGSVPFDNVDTVIGALRYIWDFAENPTVRTIRAATGLSQRAFAAEYSIPTRSVESWESTATSGRETPEYTVRMLAFAVLTDILRGE